MKSVKANPNRMELLKLRRRLTVAERGYELLKEKRDSLTQKFLGLVRRNIKLRRVVEEKLRKIYTLTALDRAVSGSAGQEESLLVTGQKLELETEVRNMLGVKVPQYSFRIAGEKFGYGFLNSSCFLDQSVYGLEEIFPSILELAELEKSVTMMAGEIEKTRRRVNALEYILIPDLRESVRFIMARLDQLERSNVVILLKMKELVKKNG